MKLDTPAKPPIPAKDVLEAHRTPVQAPQKKKLLSKFINKKHLLIIGGVIIGLIVLILLVNLVQNIQKQTKRKSAKSNSSPTPINDAPIHDAPDGLPAQAGASPTLLIESTPTQQPTQPNWQRLTSEQGGFSIDYPKTLTLQPSTDVYATLQPVWYEDDYYFDCINRQVGSIYPVPCWLLQINLNLADSQTLAELDLPLSNDGTYVDSQSRTWQTSVPAINSGKSTLMANISINNVYYQLETQVVLRSLRQFVRSHPNQLFGLQIESTDDQSLSQLHVGLVEQMLSTFTVFRKPFISEPTWLRTRFDVNWSVAYPKNWFLNTAIDPGELSGRYGNGNAVSFHQYLIRLITPNLNDYPESALTKLDNWVDYELSLLLQEEQDQIKIIRVRNPDRRFTRKQPLEVKARLLLNYPEQGTPGLTHRALIWKEDQLPHRVVIIKQLDEAYESESMQRLLDTFVKRVYE